MSTGARFDERIGDLHIQVDLFRKAYLRANLLAPEKAPLDASFTQLLQGLSEFLATGRIHEVPK